MLFTAYREMWFLIISYIHAFYTDMTYVLQWLSQHACTISGHGFNTISGHINSVNNANNLKWKLMIV